MYILELKNKICDIKTHLRTKNRLDTTKDKISKFGNRSIENKYELKQREKIK